jgi:gamma-glutamylputrescine oxidase
MHGNYYFATAGAARATLPLETRVQADVAIVGGGFTGLGAALELVRGGANVVLLEAEELGSGASGRNGGQAHVGMRRDQLWLEQHMGVEDAHKLWEIGLAARAHLDTLMGENGIECDFRAGLLEPDHKRRYVAESRARVAHMHAHYGYESLRFVSREEMNALVAHRNYYGGVHDTLGGHLHPLKLAYGMAAAAGEAGVGLYTHTRVTGLHKQGSGWRLTTARGEVYANQVILAGDGMLHGLHKGLDARVMPIHNYIAVTEPLGAERARALIANGASVSDSRFVVYYYRITPDNRLLFGGGESYARHYPQDVAGFVRPHMLKIFPQLRGVRLDYAWGGTLGITAKRMPMVRTLANGLHTAAGYSGLGVLLAPYFGRLLGQAVLGHHADFEVLARIPVSRFPGGRAMRHPVMVAAMLAFALRDRL